MIIDLKELLEDQKLQKVVSENCGPSHSCGGGRKL
ncbi:streptosactin [Lactococcus paracarnosus]